MRYHVKLSPEGADHHVDVQLSGATEATTRVDGKETRVEILSTRGGIVARVGSRIYDVKAYGRAGARRAFVSCHRIHAEVESERDRAQRTAKQASQGAAEKIVVSPMPGRVVKVLVEAGAEVTAGQGLVVVEAMKMENELAAKADGTIAKIHVEAGQTVEANAKLVTFE